MNRGGKLLGLILVLGPVSLPAQTPAFEGVVTMKMTGEGLSAEPVIFIKGTRSRMEMEMRGIEHVMIMDTEKNTMTMMMPEQKQYMVADLQQIAESAAAVAPDSSKLEDIRVEATDRKETVAGIECQHYLVTSEKRKGQADLCLAKGMGNFFGMSGGGPMSRGRNTGMPVELQRLASKFPEGAFLLKGEYTEGEQVRMTLEVTRVEKKPVSDDLFTPPAEYKKVKMPHGEHRKP
jgi:hypothetical protein